MYAHLHRLICTRRTHPAHVVFSYSLGQSYLLNFDRIGAGMSRLAKKKGNSIWYPLLFPLFLGVSASADISTWALCINIVTVTVFSAPRLRLYD